MRKSIFGILMALGFWVCKIAWAETYVSGNVSGNWTTAGSPYIVTADATVQNGTSLTIDPNVEVRFATNTSLICYGTLNAIGTPLGTITFTSDQAIHTPGHWKWIKLSGSGANGSQIKYCDIGYAKQAACLENASKIAITNNFIHDNKGDDGWVSQLQQTGCGIYLSNSNNSIIGTNTIKNNQGGQGGAGGWAGSGGSGGIGCGIYFSNSSNNTISGNTISNSIGGQGGTGGNGGGSGGSGGIGIGICLSNSTNNTILGNTISNNPGGQGGSGFQGSSGGASGQGYGIYIEPNSYNNTITITNTYNTEPIHYYYNQSGITIES
ncbi:MAG: right-handed parallel beta-helix repeat-containing protein [bacterium]